MSGPREERAQGREQSRAATGQDGAAEQPADWYLTDTYAQDPYAADPFPNEAGADPYGLRTPALPQQQATQDDPQTLQLLQPSHHEPEAGLTAPTPRWPAVAADAPSGDTGAGGPRHSESTEYVGVDTLLAKAEEPRPFVPPIEFDPPLSEAETSGPELPPEPEPEPAADHRPESSGGGKISSLVNSSAIMAAGTLVSRGTGFLRTMVIAAAIGVGTMGDSYNAANTLPTLLYILIGGGALNAVFVPQLVRAMKQDEDGGTAYANRLLTLVMAGLAGVVFLAVLGAPLLVQLISHSLMRDQASADTTVALARYCLPTIFFMGIHVVMGQILNARGRFGAMMWTPVLNNIVVIFTFGMYIWVFGAFQRTEVTPATISPEGIRLLGLGTLLGLAVQALSMIPYLRAADFHFRPRFDWRGHGLGKAARLAKWTFLFVLANQAGFLVITQLATAAGAAAEKTGHLGVGLAAYSNALLIWQLPMAVITVSVMSAVLPRLSRSAADGDAGAVRDDLSYGLRTSAVAIVPAAFLFLALGPVIGSAIYGLGNGGAVAHSTTAVGYMLSAFALGLIPYSVQYVLLRGFYAYEDTRTPFSNTLWVALCQAATAVLCWFVLPAQWAVTGMAFGYGLSYAVGVAVAVPKLKAKIGGLDTGRIAKTYIRLAIASLPAAVLGLAASLLLNDLLTGLLGDWAGAVVTVLLAGGLQLTVFALVARRMRIEELNAMIGMVRSRLGR
ncbi:MULTISPECIES: murein biosynthesis integral membrane protein MurJ [unclassified Kitasatospora]|uniref:murein biosynthesis integral membrane protein MurJ n=1 Tax=unclassified Kitasatospora TaxID=2633591 RepID=UPI00070DA8B4|nr:MULTISPECIES: murein biosynthesis integral membrane protein MurJ [unclassified Kitasatospora]KQV22195.1 murein biosynthesis protein MurJ [Kitasatospora sp. Root107]KRB64592.1 murein biosynthesis protein MurJ [Kitasatospora sp. Root187]